MMKWWKRLKSRSKKKVIGAGLALVLSVAGLNLAPGVTSGAVEFIYLISAGGDLEKPETE
jgi:hypothetical protein